MPAAATTATATAATPWPTGIPSPPLSHTPRPQPAETHWTGRWQPQQDPIESRQLAALRTSDHPAASSRPSFLPRPVDPSDCSSDASMRRHSQDMLNRLSPALRQPAAAAPPSRSPPREDKEDDYEGGDGDNGSLWRMLPPPRISGAAGIARSGRTLPPPPLVLPTRRHSPDMARSPFSSPVTAVPLPLAQSRRSSTPITARSRSALRSGGPQSGACDLHLSAPAVGPVAAAANTRVRRFRDRLRSWGHVLLEDVRAADMLVRAVALRRASSDAGAAEEGMRRAGGGAGRMTVRALVRPHRSDGRRPFVLKRSFDLDELRATIPDAAAAAPQRRLSAGSGGLASPLLPKNPVFQGYQRVSASASASPSSPSPSSSLSGLTSPRARSDADRESGSSCGQVMPIHLEYARAYLPVLAALLLSGHIRGGDVVELPLPHPQAWRQTVAHVYTGSGPGQLTDLVRQNIVYLAGKV